MLAYLALPLLLQTLQSKPIDLIVPQGSHPSLLADGYRFTEGPAWTSDGHLIWSDILGDTIYEYRAGNATPLVHPSQRAIGNTIDPQGRIVTCHQQSRSVTRLEKDGSVTVLADRFEGKRFNSPDDVVVRSDGVVYFTDPSFGLKPADKELSIDGVYKISADGKIEQILNSFAKPNGLAFSPDETILYINDTVRQQIHSFDVLPSGEITHERLFAYLTGELAGQPNGMKVDELGNVYCTGPGGIQIFQPNGKFIGLIYMPQVVTNFCFGEVDRKTLYITAGQGVYKLRVNIAGAIRPSKQR